MQWNIKGKILSDIKNNFDFSIVAGHDFPDSGILDAQTIGVFLLRYWIGQKSSGLSVDFHLIDNIEHISTLDSAIKDHSECNLVLPQVNFYQLKSFCTNMDANELYS